MTPTKIPTPAELVQATLLARERGRKRMQLRRADPNVRRLEAESMKVAMQLKRADPAFRKTEAEAKKRKRAELKAQQSDTAPVRRKRELVSPDTGYLETVVLPDITCDPYVVCTPDESKTPQDEELLPKRVCLNAMPVVMSSPPTPPLPIVSSESSRLEQAPAGDSYPETPVDLDFRMLVVDEYDKLFEMTDFGNLKKQFPEMERVLDLNDTMIASMSAEERYTIYCQAKMYSLIHIELDPIYTTTIFVTEVTFFIICYLFPRRISKNLNHLISRIVSTMGCRSSSVYYFQSGHPVRDRQHPQPNLFVAFFFDMVKIGTILAGGHIGRLH